MADQPLSLTTKLGFFYKEKLPQLRAALMLLFPNTIVTDQTQIQVDRYFRGRQRAYYRPLGGSSRVTTFENGTKQMYVPPAIGLKTSVSELDAQNVTVGVDATASQNTQLLTKYAMIQDEQSEDIMTEELIQAMDVMRTGAFTAKTEGGQDVGVFDYGRAAGNDISYNVGTKGGIKWLTEMWEALKANRMSAQSLIVIAGTSLISALEESDEFKEYVSTEHYVVTDGQQAGEPFDGVKELTKLVRIKIPGTTHYVTVLTMDATYDVNGTETPFIPDDEAIMFSRNSQRTAAYAGITIADESSKTMKTFSGEMVSDKFVSKDPDGVYLRTQSRPLFIPGNINHTCRLTGTNF